MPNLATTDWVVALVQVFGALTALFNLWTAFETGRQLRRGNPDIAKALAALKAASGSHAATLRVIGNLAEGQNQRFAQSQRDYLALDAKLDRILGRL